MQVLVQCERITDELLSSLHEKASADREQLITKVQQLLDEKESIMAQLSPPFSSEETIIGKRLTEKSTQVHTLLAALKDDVAADIKQIHTSKKSVTNYTNPYRNVGQANSYFYDKRK